MTIPFFFLLFSLGVLSTPIAALIGTRVGVVDLPGGRRTHLGTIPRAGGIAIFLPFLFFLPAVTPHSTAYLPIAIGVGGLCLLGALDDALTLSPTVRLIIQSLLCALALFLTFPAMKAIAFFLSLLFLLALINSANFLDGIDALLLSLALPPLVALALSSNATAPVALTVCALLLGFLPWNLPRARIFLGDSGSTTIGFIMGYLALVTLHFTTASSSPLSPTVSIWTLPGIIAPYLRLILLFFVFFLDLTTTLAGRILHGVSPFRADRTHIHHRLTALIGESRTRRLLFALSSASSLLFLLTA